MISLRNITLRRGTRVLLDSTSVSINPGEKVGLVGRNGAGKSSLFALLNGSLAEDGGEFSIPSQWRLGQVAQNMPETSETATQFVLDGDTRLSELNAQLAAAEASEDGMAIAHAHVDLADAGAHDAVPRAQALILGLGFKVSELEHPVNSFSGGWRMRLQLARALMCPSDLLLLDEPTNHLDLDALVWLEAWLKRYPGTLVVISHDREFLDAITNTTLHIENAQVTRYGGNYSKFEELRAQQMLLQQASFERQQEKIAHLQKFIDRFKAKASKAKQAQSRVKQIERMEKVAPMLASADFTFEFKPPANLPNPMLAITDAAFGYLDDEGQATTILRGVNRSVLAGQRIGILGANGQGKSTLVKTIAREMKALAGTVTEGKGLNIGYFAQQELDVLRPGENPMEHMIRLARDTGATGPQAREQDLRSYLGTFNFSGDMVKQAVGSMSGGEKARLVLAMIVWQRPNLLLLDEPTNHLDLATREALAMAINDFDGTVMLVSHDRALLRSVCEDFWLVGRGVVGPFDGDLDDYQRYLLEESRRLREEARKAEQAAAATSKAAAQVEPAAGAAAAAPAVQAPVAAALAPAPAAPSMPPAASAGDQREQRRLAALARQQMAEKTRPFKKELEQLDKRLPQLQAERTRLEGLLSQPISPAEMAEAGRSLKACNDEIDSLEERWLELSEQIEQLSAAMSD
ncbi:MAG: ATP-binding cassette domain-containing protein [Delftia sp.]|uniref:ABC-F family ATP-binding cassette domain-containing protein n=2 Tax=Comamonadaceae TaxID=80864 RepID=UPI00035271C7|nr:MULTISPECIES: ATP-binding cassette domain-containing protein [Delftia]EPD43337.1 ATP-binding cassette, subfamily F, member 3 [Delftia acidovorans CCUG 274B]KLO57518.1 ABC transporter [Delftia tsuruhatensis]MCX7505742.1 ATP-binding cassette domain-containing protein [Delftia tsuruhatensis]MDH0419989.1 ATP-binding cassette domain-containing protein [Delftia tsuruhatensis]MPT05473.1 ATP-binding cassette domain-containing protein [Delftia sp.]